MVQGFCEDFWLNNEKLTKDDAVSFTEACRWVVSGKLEQRFAEWKRGVFVQFIELKGST
jgi:hypothetical protein